MDSFCTSVYSRFLTALKRHDMLKDQEALLVGVSGGSDSIALLNLLCIAREEILLELVVGHVNHGLRGNESDKDERFVKTEAGKLNVPFQSERVQISGQEGSPEEKLRTARFKALTEIANSHGIRRIAVGHTRDDQAETLLLRLLRGAGSKGLGSMNPVTQSGVIRPLLDIRRDELREFLSRIGRPWREDESNENLEVPRNRVRHRLIPLLESQYNPGIVETLARTASLLREDENTLSRYAQERVEHGVRREEAFLAYPMANLREDDPAVACRVIRELILQARGSLRRVSASHVTSVFAQILEGGTVGMDLPGELRVWDEGDELRLGRVSPASFREFETMLSIPCRLDFPDLGRVLTAEYGKENAGRLQAPAPEETCLVDLEKLDAPLTIRSRRPGDRFRPFGLGHHRKLSDILIDAKVPRTFRDRIPIVCSGEKVLWVPGIRRSDLAPVGEASREVVMLEWKSPV